MADLQGHKRGKRAVKNKPVLMFMYEKILSFLKENFFSRSQSYNGSSISEKDFITFKRADESTAVAAVDGGDAVILDSGPWIISKIRVAFTEYCGKRIKEGKKEYLLLVSFSDKGISFETSSKDNVDELLPDFNALKGLKLPVDRILEIPPLVRKYSEYMTALKLAQDSKKLVIMDQLLESELNPDFLNEAGIKVLQHENIAGIAKTSRIRTAEGRSLLGYLNERSSKLKTLWYYITDSSKFIDMCAKLDIHSKYIYRIQMSAKAKPEKILGIISDYSKDSLIIGYPYPLIRADSIARIPEHERRREERILKAQSFKFLNYDSNSENFHSLMDKAMYK